MNSRRTLIMSFVITMMLTLGFVFLIQNTAENYASKANVFYKKRDTANAIKYYELAFKNGYNMSNERNIYVDLITKSSMDTDKQEKLIKFIQIPINDSATLKAKSFVCDFRKNVNRKYSDNYIQNGVYNYQVLRWSTNPITYKIENSNLITENCEQEIDNAFAEWSRATDGKILFTKTNGKANIIISFAAPQYTENSSDTYVMAHTIPIIHSSELKNMHITFYTKDINGNILSQNQIYNVALHEIGHALGFMGHSNDRNDVMHMRVNPNHKKLLTKADINTMKLLYDIKPDISDKKVSESLYIPWFVIGNKNELADVKENEAKDYVEQAPYISSGYIDLAESYLNKKDYENAIKNLKKALYLSDSQNTEGIIYYNLAITYLDMENTEMAMYYAQEACKIKDNSQIQGLIADIYVFDKKYESAINIYNKLIEKSPSNIEYAIKLTNIYIKKNQYLNARKVLKNFFKNNPQEKNNPRLKPYGCLKCFL